MYPMPAESKQKSISEIQDDIRADGEVGEALDALAYSLEHAWNQRSEDIAWESFHDRIRMIYTRAKYGRTE